MGRSDREAGRVDTPEFFRSVLDTLPLHVAVLDDDGRVEWVNRTWAAFSDANGGDRAKTCEGANYLEACARASDSGEPVSQAAHTGVAEVLYGRRQVFEFEYACHAPEEKRWFSMDVRALDWNGSRKFVAAHHNSTRQKLAQDALSRSQRLDSIGKLSGGIAHDINNLLTTIAGNSELLGDRLGEGAQPERHLAAINRATARASVLTEKLLAFARRQRLVPVNVDAGNLVRGLAEIFRDSLGEGIDVRVETVSDLWPVLVDPYQLENALLNLALNARDAMPGGGTIVFDCANVRGAAVAGAERPRDLVRIAVRDPGTGMAEDVRERAVEPFFSTREAGLETGLGLSIVDGFVAQSGGHLTIESELGHGTTVTLFFPRSRLPDQVVAEKPRAAKPETAAEGPGRILVVEDDPDVRALPVMMLGGAGYEVVEAGTAAAALEILNAGSRVDLLFTDVVLDGGVSGIDIAETARRLIPDIVILFTSGYSDTGVLRDTPVAEGTEVLPKPYRRADLLEKVRAALGG